MILPGGLPSDHKKLLQQVNDWVEVCRASAGMRAAYYRTMNAICETGRYDGSKALLNKMHKALDETAAHLFSPVELKFTMDFERPYPKDIYERGAEAAKIITRAWERNSTDITFARGVFESLKYGAAILKQWVQMDDEGTDHEQIIYNDSLVMPWNFGVYREDKLKIDAQEILCETMNLTGPEVWERVWRLPNPEKVFERIMTHGRKGQATGEPSSFFHQVLSTSQINTGVQSMVTPVPGGIVQLNNDPNYSLMGPVIATEQVRMHELWVKVEQGDYTTLQLIEPDILVTPYSNGGVVFKKTNLLAGNKREGSDLQPYRKIQPNETEGWFWGRSELVDLIEPQALLSMWCDDLRRMYGMQVDKLIMFMGENGITDETYAQFRAAGWGNMGPEAKVQDLTPQIPPEALPLLKWIDEQINLLRGFPPIMQGMGEQGVRAGSHANTLMKTASPTLRDRALIVERNCAECADLTASIRKIKDEKNYWTKGDDLKQIEETSFLLSDLPPDWRITVDSHSSSPIFSDENTQLVMAAQQRGIVDEEFAIDNTPMPNKEIAKTSARERKKQHQDLLKQLMQRDPEGAQKVLEKTLTGGKHR